MYNDLLSSVYERGWDTASKQHQTTKPLKKEDFTRILEEIGVCCWHGNGRTTTDAAILERCKNMGLEPIINKYVETLQNDPKAGVTNLVTAFYFRQRTDLTTDKTFEFTHKSFGEYLIARRFVAIMERIHQNLKKRQQNYDEGKDELGCLKDFFSLCSKTAIDLYLLRFLRDEMELMYRKQPQLVREMQDTFCRLIEFMLPKGLPVEKLSDGNRAGFQEEVVQARNTEEALFVAVHLCSRMTKKTSKVNFSSHTWLKELLHRVDIGNSDPVILDCLNNWDFSECNLSFTNLHAANLSDANLSGANLSGTILRKNMLSLVNLTQAQKVIMKIIED